jgi:hypothetical protein
MHDTECRFEPFGNKQPLARAHLGQSHGAAGKRRRRTGCFVGAIVAPRRRQLVTLGWAARQARAAQLGEHVACLTTPVTENENATRVAVTDQ